MLRIVIVGASSAIAEATARCYAARGARLFLIARQSQRLEDMTSDLKVRGAADVAFATLDVNQLDAHSYVLAQAWTWLGEVDAMLIAHGTLPDQNACEASAELAVKEFNTNGTST
ncbi:SDR family NAD(P)-dependent oxidoreductase, partial [Dyella sp.]|uniref:SDR family NAD(P)-dependent oxidoreductase n=1 Tax=Dyella sp. TaxID=1869338 RepID=UPI002CC4997C